MKDRRDIDPKYKWDLTVIYKNEEKFFEDYEKCEKLIKAYPAHEKTMLKSANGLSLAIRAMLDIEEIIEALIHADQQEKLAEEN